MAHNDFVGLPNWEQNGHQSLSPSEKHQQLGPIATEVGNENGPKTLLIRDEADPGGHNQEADVVAGVVECRQEAVHGDQNVTGAMQRSAAKMFWHWH